MRHKEGAASLPSSAAEPLLTLAEKKELKEHRVNSLLLGDLCDQYLVHIQNPNNPELPKDQVNPPQRVGAIKQAFGERAAVEKAKREAGITNLGWHQLSRHTAGSRLAANNANQRVIQEVLGHKTIAMSARYTHLSKAHVSSEMNAALSRGHKV